MIIIWQVDIRIVIKYKLPLIRSSVYDLWDARARKVGTQNSNHIIVSLLFLFYISSIEQIQSQQSKRDDKLSWRPCVQLNNMILCDFFELSLKTYNKKNNLLKHILIQNTDMMIKLKQTAVLLFSIWDLF